MVFRLYGLPGILSDAGAIESDGDGIGAAVPFVQRCERAWYIEGEIDP